MNTVVTPPAPVATATPDTNGEVSPEETPAQEPNEATTQELGAREEQNTTQIQVETEEPSTVMIDEQTVARQPNTVTVEAHAATEQPNEPTSDSQTAMEETIPTTQVVAAVQEPNDYVEQEDVFDPQTIIQDILDDDRTGRYLQVQAQYEQEKNNLQGTNVPTSAGLMWKVRGEIPATDIPAEDDTDTVGIKNFDFNNKRMTGSNRGQLRINFCDLLIHLWPGDSQKQ